jgi:hypothetical protein
MRARRRRVTVYAGFALLALVAELTGRELTDVVDEAFHVAPLATPGTPYYPFLLVGVKALAALAAASLAWRLIRAHSTATAGERLLVALGQARIRRAPRLRISLSPRLWLASFAATSLWYLVHSDAGAVSVGRWPLFAPWLHTYALPVFAVLSVLVAIGWGAVRDWLADVEDYAAATFARAIRILRRSRPLPARRTPPTAERAPRRLFGLAFESRPPPLLA